MFHRCYAALTATGTNHERVVKNIAANGRKGVVSQLLVHQVEAREYRGKKPVVEGREENGGEKHGENESGEGLILV